MKHQHLKASGILAGLLGIALLAGCATDAGAYGDGEPELLGGAEATETLAAGDTLAATESDPLIPKGDGGGGLPKCSGGITGTVTVNCTGSFSGCWNVEAQARLNCQL